MPVPKNVARAISDHRYLCFVAGQVLPTLIAECRRQGDQDNAGCVRESFSLAAMMLAEANKRRRQAVDDLERDE